MFMCQVSVLAYATRGKNPSYFCKKVVRIVFVRLTIIKKKTTETIEKGECYLLYSQ